MSVQEYESLTTEQAVAKLKAKSFHDEGDKSFARALSTYFSPEELSAITGDDMVTPETPSEGTNLPTTPEDETDGTEDEKELMKLKLDELQAKAAELELDPSGTKKEIVAKILALQAEKATSTEETV